MKQVFYLTQIGCVDSKERLSVLINKYLNEYFLDREFKKVTVIGTKNIHYAYLDLDLKEFILGEIDYSSLDVVS